MNSATAKKKNISAIDKHGCLLVFPLDNRPEPLSVWSCLYPRTPMRWEWDENGDDRVGSLWRWREELSRSRRVIYSKWYRGRATFFSPEVFIHLLSYLGTSRDEQKLPADSREALELLLLDSPQSTPVLKENLGWQGRLMESHYNRALKPLWGGLYLVGFGEVEDSSFPSLNIGASATIFEDFWLESRKISSPEAEKFLRKKLGEENPFFKYAQKTAKLRAALA